MSSVATIVTSLPSRSDRAPCRARRSRRGRPGPCGRTAPCARRTAIGLLSRDRRPQQARRRAPGVRGGHDAQAGQVHEPALAGRAVLRPEAARRRRRSTRTVTGTADWPPDMKRYFGSWLTIASPAVGRKSANMISTIGRSPTRLMPEGDAEEAVLADRRVPDALRAELLDEPDVRLEHAAVARRRPRP